MATIKVAMETSDNGYVGNQNPATTNTYDLGNLENKWRTLFVHNLNINGETVSIDKIPVVGGTLDPLLKSGGNMYGDIHWTETGKGIHWGMNTDGAGIRFNNTGDGDTNSYLEFYTMDNQDETFKWTHKLSGVETWERWMELYHNGLKVGGHWVYTEGWKPTPEAIGAIRAGNWSTNGGQDLMVHGKRALVGTANGELFLGYGQDFSSFHCGQNTIWHTGNLNQNTTLSVGSLSSSQSYITIGGRRLYVSNSEPSGVADGTVWIK